MSAARPDVALTWLFDGIAPLPANTLRIRDMTQDSRAVRAGSLFCALPGGRSHGLTFAADAVAQGAAAIVWDPQGWHGAAPDCGSVWGAAVPGLRCVLGRVADRFFGWPSAALRIVGITGTNGKTTSAYLLAQCLEHLHGAAAYSGTIGWGRINAGALEAPTHTTPDVISVHRQLAALRAAGARDVAMEVSSHALEQGRVDGVRFHAAAFTNLTRDHLDYHPSMEAYGAAKARLFAFPELQQVVINVGDAFGRELLRQCAGRVPLTAVWVGAGPSYVAERTLQGDEVQLDMNGLSMTVSGSLGACRVVTSLIGRFNADNAVLVLACVAALGVTLERAADALSRCHAPPGRMEVIEATDRLGPKAVIDYAHTPDALAKALAAAREHCRGELWCVFGCGGDRDPGKRPLMGAVVDELADQIVVTDDNPRSERPEAIAAQILDGIKSHPAQVIHDRRNAITAALGAATASDLVLIAGKGHEDYQIYGDTRRPFSDRQEALRYFGVAA